MFPITMTIHNPTQLNAVLAALSIEQPVPAPAAAVKEATAKKPDGAAQTAETKPTATTAAAESSQSVAAETGMTAAQATEALYGHADKPADAPTYQDAANAINALAKAKGRAAAVAVLAAFGAAKLPDVKPEQFADVIAAAQKA